MEYTKNALINDLINELHHLIMKVNPTIKHQTQPGFRANNYLVGKSMKDVFCYIICYDQKANLGFPNGIALANAFPVLIGTGKTHRHLNITPQTIKDKKMIQSLIKAAFSEQQNQPT